MASNHDEFNGFLDDDNDTPVMDTRADGRLLRVPLNRLAPNRVNPRKDFGTEEELADFGRSLKRRQIQALPVVTRSAYLKLWPEHAEQIGRIDFVIVSGERRYRAATAVNLPALECVVNDQVAESPKTFLDAVVSENIDRQNFDAIEEAAAIEALVGAFGTAGAVAKHYERADGWVSQRRILLRLAPDVQTLVRRREMPLEPARKLGKLVKDRGLSPEEQVEWWAQEQAERAAASAARKAARATPKVQPPETATVGSPAPAGQPPGPVFTAVKTEQDPVGASVSALTSAGDATLPPATQADRDAMAAKFAGADLPEPRPAPASADRPAAPVPAEAPPGGRQWSLPDVTWEELADRLVEEWPAEDRHRLTTKLLRVMTAERSKATS